MDDQRRTMLDRDYLLERLNHLRAVLPVFAQELAVARRQAAQLQVENRRLLEQVRQLQARRRATLTESRNRTSREAPASTRRRA